ncbi:Hypothetical predicted protein [Cloeon dipterum]|uniref:General transcription factor IIE subunit 1 n=1 Tax=Cloeon dipterum TaxID=197152 RepID=A0A8S1C8E2_9INSE|nr:Hypothetical predicted protein [Cloeon dipterum]
MEKLVTEVPSSLKQLARLIVRGFYNIEDALIIDMLVRNPCMKEDDICELLKFERKMLRSRISTLKNDKFIQVRLKMETGPDGKAQKVNYYFINYKTFVNVVKYKLDLMHKRLETVERDATSRASFRCPECCKTFTDLEADQLFNCATQEFRCTYCRSLVEEDQSALPKKDSRLMLARFNEQMETIYLLLKEVDGIKLAPEVLEPEPTELNTILGNKAIGGPKPPADGEAWSGEATRGHGFQVDETRVDISIDDNEDKVDKTNKKERPVWLVESTITQNVVLEPDVTETIEPFTNEKVKGQEDIMSVLLANEKKPDSYNVHGQKQEDSGSEASGDESAMRSLGMPTNLLNDEVDVVMMDDDDDDDEMTPTVMVNGNPVPLLEKHLVFLAFVSAAMGDDSSSGEWQFCVRAVTAPGETLAVVGDCPQLGQWKLQGALDLHCGSEGNVWRGSTRLPRGQTINYRYMVCVLVPPDGERIMEEIRVVKKWETHPQPRYISQKIFESSEKRDELEEFGLVDGLQQVERGWLTSETVIQLKLFGEEPIKMWKRRLLNKQVLVKVTPVTISAGNAPDRLAKTSELSLDESMDTLELSGNSSEKNVWPITELSVINEDDCIFQTQSQFGKVYNPGDFFLYQIQVLFPENTAYLIDFYARNQGSNEEDVPTHVGFCYILPSTLKNSEGQVIVPITGLRHQPIGQLTVEYLKVAPLPNAVCDMKEVFSRYWSHTWCGLDVGHRGAGNSFKTQKIGMAEIRENTIASLTQAARHGADFVEFDVQLSRDLVPVIYHDFHVIISMKQKATYGESDFLTLPVKDLTLQQLHLLKVYHLEEGKNQLNPRFFDEDLEDHQPFPTLQSALEKLNEHVGFNIEIKWTMQLKDGTYELYHPFDLNLYLDVVLETVLKHGGHRKIIFSCFHPDICTMIRLKQNKYPVMFLTQGATNKYPPYNDPRCHDIHGAMYFTKAAGILGVNAHTEDLLRDPSLVQAVRDAGLVLFCWGDDNNDTKTIKHLKSLGLHGVIYDKIDQLGCKEVKESIFLVEARESERQQIAALGIQSSPQSPVEPQGCSKESEEGPLLNLAPTAAASSSG